MQILHFTQLLRHLADVRQHHSCTSVRARRSSSVQGAKPEVYTGEIHAQPGRSLTSETLLVARPVHFHRSSSVQGTEWDTGFAFCPFQQHAFSPVQAETSACRSGSKCNRFSLYSGQIGGSVQAAHRKYPRQDHCTGEKKSAFGLVIPLGVEPTWPVQRTNWASEALFCYSTKAAILVSHVISNPRRGDVG